MRIRLERTPLTTLDLSDVVHEKRGRAVSGGTLAAPAVEFINSMGGIRPTSGVPVTGETAMRVAAVYACVRIIAGLGAAFPLNVYQKTGKGRRLADDHWLYELIHDDPNPEQNSFQWREADWVQELLWGNGYSHIEFDGAGRVSWLWPHPARAVTPYRNTDTSSRTYRQIRYYVDTDLDGTLDLPAYQMLHVPGLGFDGLVGKSRIGLFREPIGLALATERHGAAFFGKGAAPGVILSHSGPGDVTAAKELRDAWNSQHQGPDNVQETAVLFDNVQVKTLDINHQDLQFLETRSFQVAEIARMFGVPMWMLNENTKDTSWGSGLEQQFLAFLQVTMMPELKRREQVMTSKLLSRVDQRAGFFIGHDVEELLRGDSAAMAAYYEKLRLIGIFSPDEIRSKLNLPAIGGDAGDERIRPSNMVPIGTPAPEPAPKVVVAPPAVAPGAPAEPKPMEMPPAPPASAAGVNAAFRPLLEDALLRVIKRAQQDWPRAVKRNEQAKWLAEYEENARRQLVLVAEAAGDPDACEAWIYQLPQTEPDTWDVPALAAAAAGRCIGG